MNMNYTDCGSLIFSIKTVDVFLSVFWEHQFGKQEKVLMEG